MSTRTDALGAAYRKALYRVHLPGGDVDIAVGSHDAALDERLRRETLVTVDWAVVTPCNPGSRRASARGNAGRLAELEALLVRESRRWYRAVNVDPAGNWPDEPGFFLVDPGIAYAALLAQRFGQNALLHGLPDGPPHLHWV